MQTAQLRLENATLSRRLKIAEQLAKKLELEKNELAVKVEELMKELDSARHPRAQADSGELSEGKDVNSGICHMVSHHFCCTRSKRNACVKINQMLKFLFSYLYALTMRQRIELISILFFLNICECQYVIRLMEG